MNGIQEVSGSIPLISTKSREFCSNSRLFLCFYKQKLLWLCFMPINRLTSPALDNMILQMRQEGLSGSSINSYTRTLK